MHPEGHHGPPSGRGELRGRRRNSPRPARAGVRPAPNDDPTRRNDPVRNFIGCLALTAGFAVTALSAGPFPDARPADPEPLAKPTIKQECPKCKGARWLRFKGIWLGINPPPLVVACDECHGNGWILYEVVRKRR